MSGIGIGETALLTQRDGAFGQTLEDEVVEPSACREVDGGFDAVAGEPRALPILVVVICTPRRVRIAGVRSVRLST